MADAPEIREFSCWLEGEQTVRKWVPLADYERLQREMSEWERGSATVNERLLAEIARLRAALERIDACLEPHAHAGRSRDPEDLQVRFDRAEEFWASLINARATLRIPAVETNEVPTSRPVMNPPADEAEAGNRVHAAPGQADRDAACRGETGLSSRPEARPVTPTAHLSSEETDAPQPLPCSCTTHCQHAGYPDAPLSRGRFCRVRYERAAQVKTSGEQST